VFFKYFFRRYAEALRLSGAPGVAVAAIESSGHYAAGVRGGRGDRGLVLGACGCGWGWQWGEKWAESEHY
jgi:hypothetical protein